MCGYVLIYILTTEGFTKKKIKLCTYEPLLHMTGLKWPFNRHLV